MSIKNSSYVGAMQKTVWQKSGNAGFKFLLKAFGLENKFMSDSKSNVGGFLVSIDKKTRIIKITPREPSNMVLETSEPFEFKKLVIKFTQSFSMPIEEFKRVGEFIDLMERQRLD